ncbi:OmpA family protein [Tenacibaculum aestuariivivum]|uniref:OmpA family protein n=1 Tax=Tenacibaculum aestuariivivum TaxID=2006131 RepID=UPI003AB4DEAA
MKKITILLFIIGITVVSTAQTLHQKRADKYFNRAFYSDAIPLYETIFKENNTLKTTRNLADSHYYLYDMEKAAYFYKYLLKNYSTLIASEYYFKYAHTLKALDKNKEANIALKNYYTKKKDTASLSKLKSAINNLENIKAIGNRYKIENLAINTENSEFGAIQKGDKLIFAASKKQYKTADKIYRWNGLHYLDLYEIASNKIYLGDSIAKSFSSTINTKVHEANAVFTKDGKTIYFTRNNFVKNKRKKDAKKITHVQLFKATLIKGVWKNIQPLLFNNDGYSTEHPALSPDEKTLYFASDMEGGFGSFDIYSVAILDNGTFGIPKNLGATINTDKKEQFPFITQQNELYFSSNGHLGFGSLDVFISTINANNTFSKPSNIGLPVNSGYDDFSFTFDTRTKDGYFSSNRPGGKGNDDIYKIAEIKPLIIENCKQFISGIITDSTTKQPLANTNISIELNNKSIKKITTDVNGGFHFTALCEKSYIITASKKGYQQKQKTVITSKKRNKKNDASLALKAYKQIEREKNIALQLKAKKAQELKVKTNNKLKTQLKNKIAQTLSKEKNIVKNKDKISIKTAEINFDYKLWYLRRDAKKAINKVIELMIKYPKMIVEIGTHSDIRGNDAYNLQLSQKRANAVRNYFIENKITPNRILAVGYGETIPIIKCKTENSCTEEQHELNRRCEFIIKKIY